MAASEPVRGSFVLPLVALLALGAPLPPWIVESLYARDMYPWLQTGFTTVSNLVPFALIDVWIGLVALFVVIRAWRLVVVARQRGVFDALWELARRVVRFGAAITILFLFAWGFNYRRPPLEEALPGGPPQRPSVAALQAAFAQANTLAGRLRPSVVSQPELTFDQVEATLRPPLNAALKQLQRADLAVPGRPKHSIVLTPFFTRAGIDGMLNPFGLESLVHQGLLPFERPFVLAHEWAHLSGEADEAQASTVGWLACMNGPASFAYSGALYLINETQAAMPAEIRRASLSRLDAGVREDLVALAARLEKENPTVQRAAFRVYDEYLKANRVEDGTRSYGRALTLILSPAIIETLNTYK
jgi:hypothetical protein